MTLWYYIHRSIGVPFGRREATIIPARAALAAGILHSRSVIRLDDISRWPDV